MQLFFYGRQFFYILLLLELFLNQSLIVFSAADYSVTVTNANGCSATSAMVTVTTSQSPIPDVKSIANPQFCTGDSLLLEASTTAQGYTYQWAFHKSVVGHDVDLSCSLASRQL